MRDCLRKSMRIIIGAILSLSLFVAMSGCANSSDDDMKMTVGDIGQQRLLQKYTSFDHSYQSFNLSESDIAEIALWPKDIHIDVFFGTWCHDSQREVPRFLKIVEQGQLSNRLVALDYEKSEPSGDAAKAKVKFTPTFVVYRNNQEIGRIIERPNVSIVSDISAML